MLKKDKESVEVTPHLVCGFTLCPLARHLSYLRVIFYDVLNYEGKLSGEGKRRRRRHDPKLQEDAVEEREEEGEE